MRDNINTDMATPAKDLLIKGWRFYTGENQAQDFVIAAQCWLTAAQTGNAMAMYNLACLYMHGQGVAADHAKGMEWLKKAADLDNNRARDALRDVAKVGQSHFNVALTDINFAKRRLYVIVGLVALLALIAAAIISIPNKFGFG